MIDRQCSWCRSRPATRITFSMTKDPDFVGREAAALEAHNADVRRKALLEAAEHLEGGGTGYCLDSEQPHVWAAKQVRELAEKEQG